MLVFKKWLIPIELLNLALIGLILAGLLLPKSKFGPWVFGAERDYQVLESYLNTEMKKDEVPGFWLLLVNEEEIVYQHGFGNETNVPPIPVEQKLLSELALNGKSGRLHSTMGDFRWQWSSGDGYCKIMITGLSPKTGVIMILDRHTGIKRAGNLAVKTFNRYWGTDIDPGAFNAL